MAVAATTSRTVGSWSPTSSTPIRSACRTCWTICRYGGTTERLSSRKLIMSGPRIVITKVLVHWYFRSAPKRLSIRWRHRPRSAFVAPMTGMDDPAFYGETWAGVSDEQVAGLDPAAAVEFLAGLAGGGRGLELGVGSGGGGAPT